MSQLFSLQTALCLPVPDIEALMQGRTIAAVPRMFIRPGQQFALYPVDFSAIPISAERYYQANFIPITPPAANLPGSQTVLIKAWAKCELCQVLDGNESLENLSRLTAWTVEGLQEILRLHQHIFLTYLRVYQLPQFQEVSVNSNIQDKVGKFIGLPNSLTVSEAQPVLSDRVFHLRKHQLETRQPPQYPELEYLQSALAQLSPTNPAAKNLEEDIKILLGWSSNQGANSVDSDLAWIHQISSVGNSSDGHSFEKLVRKGLLKLGFTGSGLAADSTGGAGGMDFYGEYPYPIVGECKATKSEKVPDGTPAQLLKIGMNHLGKTQYDRSIKLIVAAGELNSYALRTATENEMNVIRPETLQRLVEMQAHYKGSINLLQLKQCLQQAPFGLADDKVNNYIDKIYQDIKQRSQLVLEVKKYLDNTGFERASIDSLHGAFSATNPNKLKPQEMHEILVELSSPLTGYLGRIKGEDWRRDRFYFLRDLPITYT